MRLSIVVFSAFLATALLEGLARGATDAEKCESAKNKIAGKYAFCRQKAEAKAITKGGAPDYSKCDAQFAEKWAAAEAEAGGMCPTSGDQSAVQNFITAHTNTVAGALIGPGLPTVCGDNTINLPGEQCDGPDLGGSSCVSLGFSGGALGCSASCAFDTSACSCGVGAAALPRTGQTQCDQGAATLGACPGSPAGQDAAVLAGVVRSYTDNGDGTITDNATGLMWEKISDDGTIHDKDNAYSWYNAPSMKIATLNASGGFAGHTDWRMPNIVELLSLVDYGQINPPLDSAFNTGCVPGCSVLTCSCPGLAPSNSFLSSTTNQSTPLLALFVDFENGVGSPGGNHKSAGALGVRAVRGGL